MSIRGPQHIKLDDTFILLINYLSFFSMSQEVVKSAYELQKHEVWTVVWCLASTIRFQELWSSSSKHLSIAGWWYTACSSNSAIGLQHLVSQWTNIQAETAGSTWEATAAAGPETWTLILSEGSAMICSPGTSPKNTGNKHPTRILLTSNLLTNRLMPLIACRIELPATELAFHATICRKCGVRLTVLAIRTANCTHHLQADSNNLLHINAIIYNPRAWKRIPCWDILRTVRVKESWSNRFEDFEALKLRPPGPGLRTRAPSPPRPLRRPSGYSAAELRWVYGGSTPSCTTWTIFFCCNRRAPSHKHLRGCCLWLNALLPLSIAHPLWLGLLSIFQSFVWVGWVG